MPVNAREGSDQRLPEVHATEVRPKMTLCLYKSLGWFPESWRALPDHRDLCVARSGAGLEAVESIRFEAI